MQKLYFIFATCLLCFFAKAQDNYRFASYTVNDGLPQGSIWDITQDKNGFIWASTSDGLCRFDGFKFTVYKHNPKDSTSINYEKDNRFFVDKQQQLWISSERGISLYNYSTNKFKNIYSYKPDRLQLQNYSCFYGEYNGFLWAGLPNIGFIKIDKKTHQYSLVKKINGTDLSTYLYWIKGFIEDGNIYGNNENAFFRYNLENNSITLLNEIKVAAPTLNISKDELLTANSTNFFFINKKNLQVRKVPIHLPKLVQIATDIHFNNEDSSQVILATPIGLQYLDISSGKLIKTISDFDPGKESKYSYAECLFTDKSGNFWIGTNGDGLRKMMHPFKKFKHYKTNNAKSSIVKSVYADYNKLLVGYFNNGIDIFSRKNGFKKNLDIAKIANIPNNNVYSILPLNRTEFLLNIFGENETAFFIYSIATNKFTNVTSAFSKFIPSYPSLKTCLFAFLQKGDGTFLAGCNEYLLSVQYIKGKLDVKQIDYLKNENINTIFQDKENSLWIGTFNGVLHFKKNKWMPIQLQKNVVVKTINQDNDGNIWVGSVEGLYVIDKNDKVTNLYNEQTGLINHHIYCLLKDDDGNIWYSSNKGLGVYHTKEKKFKFFTKEDGVQANEFNSKASFKTNDGELFFGGINGTNSFYPKEILNNPHVPQVKITGIKLFDEPYKTDSAYWNIHSLELPYTDNSLSFEFVLPEFTNQQKNQYAYLMEGIDKNWINSGDKRFARYAGLNPGKYTFKVKACNNDGVWNEQPTTISIYIVPPFWQRLWFIVLAGLLLVSLIVFIVVFIQKQQFKKKMRAIKVQHKIQLERERISRDLHDNVGTQLSLISKSIHGMLQNDTNYSEEDQKQKLKLTGQNSLDVISALRETIWALNKESIALQEFFDKLKSFAQKQMSLNEQTKLWFTENITNVTVVLGPSEALHLFRICQESITNSLKYAQAKNITIHVETNKDKYSVCLTDDGRGFDKNVIDTAEHYGIENMKHRANEIACELIIETTINQGTSIQISKK